MEKEEPTKSDVVLPHDTSFLWPRERYGGYEFEPLANAFRAAGPLDSNGAPFSDQLEMFFFLLRAAIKQVAREVQLHPTTNVIFMDAQFPEQFATPEHGHDGYTMNQQQIKSEMSEAESCK